MSRPSYRIPAGALAVFFIFLFLAFPNSQTYGADYYGNSQTIPYVYQYYNADKSTDRFSIYENANIHAEKFGVSGLSLHFGGWGRWDAVGKDYEEQTQPGDADLGYAYLQWVGLDGALSAILGRHWVVAGATAESLDGLDLSVTLVKGLVFRAFGGVPVYSKFGERSGDWGGGGRLSYAYDRYFEIGASGNTFLENGRLDRRNVGGDLYVSPVRNVDLIGHVFVDTIFSQVYDAAGVLTVYPIKDWRLQGGYSRVMPASFLGKSSYFSVFSAETIDKIDAETAYLIRNRVRVLGGYSRYAYDLGDDANRAGGGAELLWGKQRENSFGGRYFRLSKKDNGYDEVRGYLYQQFASVFHVAANSTTYFLDHKIYDVGTAFSGDLSLGWDVTKRLGVQATGVVQSTPYYKSDYRALLKIGYNVERSF